MSFEDFATEKGFDLATLDGKNKTALETLYNAILTQGEQTLTASEGAAPDDPEDKNTQPGKNATPDKKDEGLKARLTMPATQRVFSSMNTPAKTAGSASHNAAAPNRLEVLQCSALMGLGVPAEWLSEEGDFSERCVRAAEREKDASLLTLMGEVLTATGLRPDYRNPRMIVENFRETLQSSAISTRSLGDVNVFSPIIDKQMRYKYERMVSIWSRLYRKRIVRDFNEVATVNLDVQGGRGLRPSSIQRRMSEQTRSQTNLSSS